MKTLIATFLVAFMAIATVSAQQSAGSQQGGHSYVRYTVLPTQNRYSLGEEATLRVDATLGGNNAEGCEVQYEAGVAGLGSDISGTAAFHHGEATIPFGTMRTPGFRFCKVRFTINGQTLKDEVTVAFSPDSIRPTVSEPSDFDAFWAKTLKRAAKVPMVYEITDCPEYSDDSVLCQRVRLQAYEKGFFFCGYLSRPRTPGKHPVMLFVPGAGVKRTERGEQYARNGYITLGVNIHGIPTGISDSLLSAKKKEIGDYWLTGIDNRDTYYYRRVYASLVRCIDFLTQLPEWDGKNVGVTGGSQGGALTIVTAALDRRVTMLSAFYPALCDIGGYERGSVGGWPNINRQGTSTTLPHSQQWLTTVAYYDVALMAKRVTAPGFYSYGYNDRTCSPTSVTGALNMITAEKHIVVTPSSSHGRFQETQQQNLTWLRQHLK